MAYADIFSLICLWKKRIINKVEEWVWYVRIFAVPAMAGTQSLWSFPSAPALTGITLSVFCSAMGVD